MILRRLFLVTALALGLCTVAPTFDAVRDGTWTATADAGPSTTKESSRKKAAVAKKKAAAKKATARKAAARRSRSKKSAKVKLCSETRGSGKKKRRRCTFVREFQGHGVASTKLRTDVLERPTGDVWLSVENLREETKLNIFKPDGSYDEGALAKLDELFRCRRTGEVRSVDPRLYEQLSRIYDHFGARRIDLVSGFRFAERNSSRHYHASAMDIRIKGVTIREMYDYAESLDGGGMGIGIYPHSGFVHVDFRAPGEPSYRWTDYSGPNSGKKHKSNKKRPGRTSRAKKPTS